MGEKIALLKKNVIDLKLPSDFDQAKAMEKENSEISFFAGYNYEGGHPIDEHEQYYNKTFTEKCQ